MAIHWGSQFLTGIGSIDQDHQRLAALVNKFEDIEGKTCPDDTARAFEDFCAFAARHFAREEEFMAQAGLDAETVSVHREEHAAFLASAEGVFQKNSRELFEYLTRWIYQHVLVKDHALARSYYASVKTTPPLSVILSSR